MDALGQALQRLQARHPRKIDLGLDRIRAVLERLEHPEMRLPRTIHVAGTNGKGSTVAYLTAIAKASGQDVHAYTSPHLIHFTERFVVQGRQVDAATLVDVLDRVETAAGNAPLSFFEATTAAGFLLFAEHPADWLMLEVGLGGRFDATNVIASPACAVITPVGLDHREFLGDTLAAIAAEKAGILKSGAPAVIGPQEREALMVIETRCRELGISPWVWGRDFDARSEHGRLVVELPDRLLDLDMPALYGRHQIANAGTAIAASIRAGLCEDADALSRAMREVVWPGRLQRLHHGAAAALAGGELWLDGAHNPMGARALAQTMADIGDSDPLPLVLILGMQANKDARAFLAPFEGLVRHVVCVELESAQTAHRPEDLAELAREFGMSAETAPSLHAALTLAGDLIDEPHVRVLASGSLYLVAEVLNFEDPATRQLTHG